jgi:membrane fusion protein (multidrug efflux system)
MPDAQDRSAQEEPPKGPSQAEVLSAEVNPLANDDAAQPSPPSQKQDAPPPPPQPWRKWLFIGGGAIVLAVAAYYLAPWITTLIDTVSTDDAYVNGHLTFVAPQVSGQVTKVLVDDNYRVKKGDLLIQLDKEPYEVQAALKWR